MNFTVFIREGRRAKEERLTKETFEESKGIHARSIYPWPMICCFGKYLDFRSIFGTNSFNRFHFVYGCSRTFFNEKLSLGYLLKLKQIAHNFHCSLHDMLRSIALFTRIDITDPRNRLHFQNIPFAKTMILIKSFVIRNLN